jgi:3-deoxy-D-manno-octulosonic-acid transferase
MNIFLYNLIQSGLFFLGLPLWLWIAVKKKYRSGLWRKLCFYSEPQAYAQGWILIHGVSVGEINAALPFIKKLKERFPNQPLLLTSSTETGIANARRQVSGVTIEYFPLDFYCVLARFFKKYPLQKIFILETEIWPNFFYLAKKQNIPLYLVNARLSKHSFPRYLFFKGMLVSFLENCKKIFCQSEWDRKHFLELGIPEKKLEITPSMKFDAAVMAAQNLPKKNGPWTKKLESSLVWVAASTQENENRLCVEIYQTLKKEFSNLVLVLVPRKTESLRKVLTEWEGVPYSLHSTLKEQEKMQDLLLIDSMGELFYFLQFASVVFVGKTFSSPGGGQNPLEPAALGKAIIVGPSYENFKTIVEEMETLGAIVVTQKIEALREMLRHLLKNQETRNQLGTLAKSYVLSKESACDKILDQVFKE